MIQDTQPTQHQLTPWQFETDRWHWGDRTYVMGVLNVTPDSFSDGGEHHALGAALHHAHAMVAQGADVIDVGGQSTRPNAETVSVEVELERTIPVILALRQGALGFPPLTVPISIDTTHATVAREAIAVGADIVNDVSAATYDARMLATVAELEVPIILMHLRGTPQTMQQLTDYADVVTEVRDYLAARVTAAAAAGIPRSHIVIDPGIGFAKVLEHNLALLRRLPELRAIGCPILVGPSRKRFIGTILDQPDPKLRVWGTGAACAAAIAGGADLVRVHDVAQMVDVCRVSDAIWRNPS